MRPNTSPLVEIDLYELMEYMRAVYLELPNWGESILDGSGHDTYQRWTPEEDDPEWVAFQKEYPEIEEATNVVFWVI